MPLSDEKLKELLDQVRSYHNFEIDQIGKHIQTSQYIILVAGIFLSTSIFAVSPVTKFQTYLSTASIASLIISIFLSFPYSFFSSASYKLSPRIDYMIDTFSTSRYNYTQYVKWLLKIYNRSIYENRIKNLRKHYRQKIALLFVLGGGLCLSILAIVNYLNSYPCKWNQHITIAHLTAKAVRWIQDLRRSKTFLNYIKVLEISFAVCDALHVRW